MTESSTQRAERKKAVVVGVGTSAGGVAALETLLQTLPEKPGFAVVVVIHLPPDSESHLAELLQVQCSMKVTQVTETTPLEPDQVYVIPPGSNLNTIDTHLRLSEFEEPRGRRLPIDHFFTTLARTHGPDAIGVVLTGTGTDGTLGLRRIRERGGLTVAQDPDEAEYDGMPRSALAADMVDLTLPLKEMGEHFLQFTTTVPQLRLVDEKEEPPRDEDRLLQKLFARVRAQTGQDFSPYKRSTIMRRITRRMQLHGVETLSDYLELLRSRHDEVSNLFEDLLITVSEFFRDEEVFTSLSDKVIPKLFEDKGPEEAVRLWSVGCSTGEEAYSLAMLLLEEASRHKEPPQLQVFASDLHERSLGRAREGLYPASIAASVAPERLERFFTEEVGNYRVRRQVREMVVFAPHNLLKDPPFSHLDMVVCRNLLIYLQRDIQREVIALLHYALDPQGFLVLGSSETVDRTDLFQAENKSLSIYRRRSVPTREPFLPIFASPARLNTTVKATSSGGERSITYGALHEKMVELYGPPSILTNEDDDVVHYSASAGRFLRLPGGEPTNNLIKLVHSDLALELRITLQAAKESGESSQTKPVPLELEGKRQTVVAQVRPVGEDDMRGFFLVLFNEIDELLNARTRPSASETTEGELSSELELTKQRLRAVIDDYETGQEEMQASNEELQSTNEELRSTMEELETSKEELQSMNEELTTLNQENRHKVEELSQLSADLQNLLAATDIATLFLDRQMRIIRFTPQIADLFNIRHNDKGRPLTDLTHRLDGVEMVNDARRVLDRLTPLERETTSTNGRCYLTRTLPYRASDDRIEGVVITFIDITDRVEAEEALRQTRDELEERVIERTRELEQQAQLLRHMSSELATAEHRERKRLAALLHDGLQQTLVAAKIKLRRAKQKAENAQVVTTLETVEQLLGDSIQSARDLTTQLRPPALYEDGLASAFIWLAGEMERRHDVHVDLLHRGAPLPLEDNTKALLFDCARELLFNAVKYSGAETVRLELEEGEEAVTIVVVDRGRGFQLEENSGDHQGGFGLFSVRERVRALGGTTSIEAAPEHGCRVELVVPLENVPFSKKRPPPSSERPPGERALKTALPTSDGQVRVLLVDDHSMVRKGIAALLEEAHQVSIVGQAANGFEAIELAQELEPQVVLLDVNMPRMNGMEATRELLARWPELVVIGLSVQDDQAMAESMYQAGAKAFVAKSAAPEELLATILDHAGQEQVSTRRE